MSIASEITRLRNAKAALKESIEAKGVTVEDSAKLDEYPTLVDSIPQGGGGGVEEKDVNFYDYDGTCLYSYTKDKFLALSEMPALPDHSDEGLSNEGWNWTLEDCKEQVKETEGNNIAAIYEPTDGAIKIFIDITELNIPMFISLRCNNNNSVEIDWGDNSEKSTNSATGTINFEHNYQNLGIYTISIKCLRKNAIQINSYLFKDTYESDRGGCGRFVNKIFLSKNFSYYEPIFGINIKTISLPNILTNTTFKFTESKLTFIGIPNGFDICPNCGSTPLNNISFSKTIYNYPSYCLAETFLKGLYLPKNDAASIIVSNYAFNFKVKGKKLLVIPSNFKNILSLPAGFETIIFKGAITATKFPSDRTFLRVIIFEGTSTFSSAWYNGNYVLMKLVLPSTVTSINNASSGFYAKYNCLYLYANIPPTLSSSTFGFDKIYVPAESVEAYKTATNWSALADKIFPIPTE